VLLDQEPRANQRSDRFVDLVASHVQAEGDGLAVAGDHAVGALAGEQPEHRPQRPAGLGQAMPGEVVEQAVVQLDPGRPAVAVMLELGPVLDAQPGHARSRQSMALLVSSL
jgi:hypothetical protein